MMQINSPWCHSFKQHALCMRLFMYDRRSSMLVPYSAFMSMEKAFPSSCSTIKCTQDMSGSSGSRPVSALFEKVNILKSRIFSPKAAGSGPLSRLL